MTFVVMLVSAVVALGGVTFDLLIDRMNKSEVIAASEIAALREEIKSTKADSKDAVAASILASKDAVAATAVALKESNAATALASSSAVIASASALRDQVAATAVAASQRIDILSRRIDKLEDLSITAMAAGENERNDRYRRRPEPAYAE